VAHEVGVSWGGGVAGSAWEALLEDAAQRALEAAAPGGARELSVHLTSDAGIAALNARWRRKHGPTDVLSFAAEGEAPPGVPSPLGDVVLSVDTAARQAAALGHGVDAELVVLLVHGLCHLLGYDHERGASEAAAMAAEEQRLLTALGRADLALTRRVEGEGGGR
jgi:probable rRNA maturation factor